MTLSVPSTTWENTPPIPYLLTSLPKMNFSSGTGYVKTWEAHNIFLSVWNAFSCSFLFGTPLTHFNSRFISGKLLGIGLISVPTSCLTMSTLPWPLLFVAKAQAFLFSSFLALFRWGAVRPATHFSTFTSNSCWALNNISASSGNCLLSITASTGAH